MFGFTRSLLQIKTIQTDVLIEELKSVGTRLDSVNKELDHFKATNQDGEENSNIKSNFTSNTIDETMIQDLQDKLRSKDIELEEVKQRFKKLEDSLKRKDLELASFKTDLEAAQYEIKESKQNIVQEFKIKEMSSDTFDDVDFQQIENQKFQINEKDAMIEQLLDRVYDSDKINLELAEQIAKLRLEQAKVENEHKIAASKIEMLTDQVDEFRRMNELFDLDRNRKEREIESMKQELEKQKKLLRTDKNDELSNTFPLIDDVKGNLYQELLIEIKRLSEILQVKDFEIEELRGKITDLSHGEHSLFEQKREEIERLEQELAIVQSSLKPGEQGQQGLIEDVEGSVQLIRKQRRRIRKLRKDKLNLLVKISELEKEASSKDEVLQRHRRRTISLIGKLIIYMQLCLF